MLDDLAPEERRDVQASNDPQEARALLGRRLLEQAYTSEQVQHKGQFGPSRHELNPRTAHASGLAVAIASSHAPATSGVALSDDVSIAIVKIPSLTALSVIECSDFASYVDTHFSDVLSEEETFDLVYCSEEVAVT